jgi:hypothetical protein
MLFTSVFWRDAATRAIRSFAQTLAAALGGNALNVWVAGWHQSLGLAAGSALLAILMAVDRSTVPQTVEVVAPVASVAPLVSTCGDALR